MTRRLPVVLLLVAACDFYPEADILGDGLDTDPVVDVYLDEISAEEAQLLSGPGCSPELVVPAPQVTTTKEGLDLDQDVWGANPAPVRPRISVPSYDPSRGLSVLWQTDLDTLSTQIQLGRVLDGELEEPKTYVGGSFVMGSSGNEVRNHEVKLCRGLRPNTTYRYRMGGEGNWSDWYEYTMPGEPGSFSQFRVAVIGDSRGGYDDWARLMALITDKQPDIILFSGDMAEWGTNQGELNAWLDGAGDLFTYTPFIPAHGNHEFLSVNYFGMWSLPNNEAYFHIDYGNLRVMSLIDILAPIQMVENEQVLYMDANLPKEGVDWRFIVHHAPEYSVYQPRADEVYYRDVWTPVFDRNDVDMSFTGHNHLYERSVPITDGAQANGGVTYIVTGGGGAPLYRQTTERWYNVVANPVLHYMIGDVDGTSISWTVRDDSDTVIDTFTISK